MTRTTVEVVTRRFEQAHGGTPRGHGAWAFCTVDPRRHALDYLDHVLWHTGRYGEAKRAATADARTRGVTRLWLCP